MGIQQTIFMRSETFDADYGFKFRITLRMRKNGELTIVKQGPKDNLVYDSVYMGANDVKKLKKFLRQK